MTILSSSFVTTQTEKFRHKQPNIFLNHFLNGATWDMSNKKVIPIPYKQFLTNMLIYLWFKLAICGPVLGGRSIYFRKQEAPTTTFFPKALSTRFLHFYMQFIKAGQKMCVQELMFAVKAHKVEYCEDNEGLYGLLKIHLRIWHKERVKIIQIWKLPVKM